MNITEKKQTFLLLVTSVTISHDMSLTLDSAEAQPFPERHP